MLKLHKSGADCSDVTLLVGKRHSASPLKEKYFITCQAFQSIDSHTELKDRVSFRMYVIFILAVDLKNWDT